MKWECAQEGKRAQRENEQVANDWLHLCVYNGSLLLSFSLSAADTRQRQGWGRSEQELRSKQFARFLFVNFSIDLVRKEIIKEKTVALSKCLPPASSMSHHLRTETIFLLNQGWEAHRLNCNVSKLLAHMKVEFPHFINANFTW